MENAIIKPYSSKKFCGGFGGDVVWFGVLFCFVFQLGFKRPTRNSRICQFVPYISCANPELIKCYWSMLTLFCQYLCTSCLDVSHRIYFVFIITEVSDVQVMDSVEDQERPKQGFGISLMWRNSTAQETSEVDSACFLTATGEILLPFIQRQYYYDDRSSFCINIRLMLSLNERCEEPSWCILLQVEEKLFVYLYLSDPFFFFFPCLSVSYSLGKDIAIFQCYGQSFKSYV